VTSRLGCGLPGRRSVHPAWYGVVVKAWLAMVALLLTGCRALPVAPRESVCARVQGDRQAMALTEGAFDLHGFTLVVQQVGGRDEPDFLFTVRGPSVRRLLGPASNAEGCTVPPGPREACSHVNHDDLMWELIHRTRAREGHVDVLVGVVG
jgi:hypothetical protein